MKKKARLLFTNDCNRRCKGCCNKNWTGDAPMPKTFEELKEYDEIFITGGEPMLYPEALKVLIRFLRTDTNKIFLYTAKPFPTKPFYEVMELLDGCSITLHTQADRSNFLADEHLKSGDWFNENQQIRLNNFVGNEFPLNEGWNYRQMKWIIDAPLPQGEDFVKLSNVNF